MPAAMTIFDTDLKERLIYYPCSSSTKFISKTIIEATQPYLFRFDYPMKHRQ